MDQVTASVETWFDDGERLMVTTYTSSCGCDWKVDMWGNVRRVKVCPRDLSTPIDRGRQQYHLFNHLPAGSE